jgi:hypothetical protein
VFLKNAGVPGHLIDYIELFTDKNEKYYSCFISCSSRDQKFAENLQSYLQAHGVRCWLATEKTKRRDRRHKIINSAVNIHDRVIMILSENSVEQDWTENEIETVLQKENKDGSTVLLPLAIDDAIKFTEKPWAIKMRRAHRIHDFSMWEDSNEFQEEFSQLLTELNTDEEQKEAEVDFQEDYEVKSDRYTAVIDQKIAWNNIRYARLS